MADPRVTPEFEGIDARYATYVIDDSTITYDAAEAGGSAEIGLAVTLSADRTVALAADAEAIEGKLILVEADNNCLVQVGGYMTLPAGTSATLGVNSQIVGDLLVSAKGYIRAVDSATAAELALSRGSIIDDSTTTAVIVRL